MKRWSVRIVVFLILGTIVNVVVAWACAIPVQWFFRTLPGVQGDSVSSRWSLVAQPDWPPAPKSGNHVQGIGIEYVELVEGIGAAGTITGIYEVVDFSNGWPCRSVRGQIFRTPTEKFRTRHTLIAYILPLPYGPIWPGFAINTVFYAVILWLLFAGPFVLRRRRRIRRGLCPKCAYDLRGSADAAACPECGSIMTCTSR